MILFGGPMAETEAKLRLYIRGFARPARGGSKASFDPNVGPLHPLKKEKVSGRE
jgi:hypothetical protein